MSGHGITYYACGQHVMLQCKCIESHKNRTVSKTPCRICLAAPAPVTPASKGLTREEARRLAARMLYRCTEDHAVHVAEAQKGDSLLSDTADLLLSVDRSARESEWEARGGPELEHCVRWARSSVLARRPMEPRAFYAALIRCADDALACIPPATEGAPASEEGR